MAQNERSLVREGNKSYDDKNYADAEVDYRKALEKNKELVEGAFNLGDAMYKQGRFDEAAEQYRIAAAQSTDARTRAQAYHNLGNALLKAKKLQESVGSYEQSLKANPSDDDTKYNLEYAKALLRQQMQQQNKDQKNDNKKDKDQQKQDQQKQDQQKKDQQKQDQQKQDQQKQDQQKQDQQKQGQQKKPQISKQDAERILAALKNEEQNVQKKLVKKIPARVKVEKDW
jgi:tetratricopeptide (TPR) repeat protein